MNGTRWEAVNQIFHAALELPESGRQIFVSSAAQGDTQLEQEVLRLLKADSEAGHYLENPIVETSCSTGYDPSPAPFEPGDILKGRFRIDRHVGFGGMGHVCEAWDLDLKVRVALKVIRPEVASNPAALEYFRREVRTARTITHINVCRTFDLDRCAANSDVLHPQERYFLTMEFLDGETLASRIQRDGPLTTADAYSIAHQIASGLDAAHAAGVIHRDLKPANIMLVPASEAGAAPRAVITDFGLARGGPVVGDSSTISHGALKGTLAYMAPEQLHSVEAVTEATDIYAFGLVLFEMVTGERAYPSANLLGGIAQRLTGEPPFAKTILAGLPTAWECAIEGCLRPEPGNRFRSASQVIEVLEGRAGALSRVDGSRKASRAGTSIPRRRSRWSIAVTVSFACVSLFSVWLRLYHQNGNSQVAPGALVYLAPTRNLTREMALDNLTELLQAGLSQSVQINLLDQGRVGDTLQLMTEPPDTPITEPIAREIAMRSGAVRVVFPTVTGSNGDYRLHIDIQQPDNTPARYRDHWSHDFDWHSSGPASSSRTIPEQLTTAIRKASDWIRFQAGESRNDIARLDIPPEDVTTSNWQALEKFDEALRFHALGRTADAVYSLQTAVKADPQFALAFGRLGDLEVSLEQFSDGFQSYEMALDTGEQARLTRRERDRIQGLYAMDTCDYAAAEAAFRDYSIYYANDYLGAFYRGYPLMMLGRTDEALETLRRSSRLAPSRPSPPLQLGLFDASLGNVAEANQMAAQLRSNGYDFHSGTVIAVLDFVQNRYSDAMAEFERIGTDSSAQPSDHPWALSMQARIAAEQGDYRSAANLLNEAIHESSVQGDISSQAAQLLDRAYVECKEKKFRESIQDVRQATGMESSSKSRIFAALVLGENLMEAPDLFTPVIRQSLMELNNRSSSDHVGLISDISRNVVLGYLLLANHRWNDAIPVFRKASALDAPGHPRAYLPQALVIVAMHMHDAAAARALRIEALKLYAAIASHPNLIWYSSKNYPPGYYGDQIGAYLALAFSLGEPSGSVDRARSLYSKLRPQERPIH